ncbi:MAG TPA: LysR family transcriptional regulator [Steroidobacteraceae bacterium]|nr:LysR family transcriptional regulator [Steroidobacteraceae bacterium]
MDLDAVAVFVKVVETGSFSAAARRLGMPKATVSAKVARLEKHLRVSLIQRTTRKLRVTEAGEQYFRHCAQAIRTVELAEASLQSASGRPSGLLKVTAPVDLGHTLLPRIAHAYAGRYPDVSVELLIANRVVDLVGEGIDLAIRSSRALKDSALIARRFFEMSSNLWAAPRYLRRLGEPGHPRDLQGAAFVGLLARSSVTLTDGKTEVEVPMTGRIRADDFETVKSLLLLGEGIAWLPDFLAADAAAAGALVPVLPQWRPKDRAVFYFVYPGRKYGVPKVEAFIATALELAQPQHATTVAQHGGPSRSAPA